MLSVMNRRCFIGGRRQVARFPQYLLLSHYKSRLEARPGYTRIRAVISGSYDEPTAELS